MHLSNEKMDLGPVSVSKNWSHELRGVERIIIIPQSNAFRVLIPDLWRVLGPCATH